MKRILTFLLLSITFCGLNAQSIPNALRVKKFTLSNGLEVWINEDHSQPMVNGALVVHAGAVDCPDTGIAHYFEHIMFKGTNEIGTVNYEAEKVWLDKISDAYDSLAVTENKAKRDSIQKSINALSVEAAKYAIPNEYDRLISYFGGSHLNAGTGYDMTEYHNTFASGYLEEWAKLNSDRVIYPVYRLFQGELETVYEEKNMYSDNMMAAASERVLGRFFDGTPYAYPIIGSTKNIKNPQQSQMDDFYSKYYVAGNMKLILCGDVYSEKAQPILEKTFGRIKPGIAPERPQMSFKELDSNETYKIKVPIPLVKAGVRLYRGPKFSNPDNLKLSVAMGILTNSNQTGLLDSLRNANKVMMVEGSPMALKDAGMIMFLAIPNIPFGSVNKAMKLTDKQLNKLCYGDFSTSLLEASKEDVLRNYMTGLESVSSRIDYLLQVAGNGGDWNEYIKEIEALKNMTKEDVAEVASKYFQEPYMSFKKKTGSYPKDHVTQPGYKPVVPENIDKESEYAVDIKANSKTEFTPRLVDFATAAKKSSLSPLSKLYTVENPLNDIFTLKITYYPGLGNRMLAPMSAVLSESGTDSLSFVEFSRALQNLGANFSLSSGERTCSFYVKGEDCHFDESMKLIKHFLNHAKADPQRIKDLAKNYKLETSALKKENSSLAIAALTKIVYNDKSKYIDKLNYKETKALKPSDIENSFKDVQKSECNVVYTGKLSHDKVAECAKKLVAPSKEHGEFEKKLLVPEAPMVYFVNSPGSRQNTILTYTPLPASKDANERAAAIIWGSYFGGDMFSVMFQEIREMRAMAYSAQGSLMKNYYDQAPDSNMGYMTYIGTQADKTNEVLSVLDSIFKAMPVRESNLQTSRRSLLNKINNSYPSFRSIGSYVAGNEAFGAYRDPNACFVLNEANVSEDDILDFYKNRIKNASRVIIVVGDRKKTDFETLKKFGSIKELDFTDFYRE